MGQECGPLYQVPREEILEAMQSPGDYTLTATTNAARFGAEVLLRLVRARQQKDPDSMPLLVLQSDWFASHLKTAAVASEEMSVAARMGYEYQQDAVIEYGIDRVLAKVEEGPVPLMALSVRVFWRKAPNSPSEYSYLDTLSVPRLKVTNSREIRFKLVEYEDMLVFDQVTGISGRPLGFFSVVFAVLGDPDFVHNRIAISEDQWQVMRGRARGFLGISKTRTATFEPSGRGHEGVPADRPDLRELEERLTAPLRLRYKPTSC